jgi:hypothetical protein
MNNPYMEKYARVVRKEMDRYGFDLTVIRKEDSVYDPALGTAVDVTTEFKCRGILFDLTLQSNGTGTSKNSLITAGDKQIFIEPADQDGWYQDNELDAIKPERDKILIGSTLYSVITVKQINPSTNCSVLYDCYIRA